MSGSDYNPRAESETAWPYSMERALRVMCSCSHTENSQVLNGTCMMLPCPVCRPPLCPVHVALYRRKGVAFVARSSIIVSLMQPSWPPNGLCGLDLCSESFRKAREGWQSGCYDLDYSYIWL